MVTRTLLLTLLLTSLVTQTCLGRDWCHEARRWVAAKVQTVADYYYPPLFFPLPSGKQMLLKFGNAHVFEFKPGWYMEFYGKTLLHETIKAATEDAKNYLVMGSGSGYLPIGLAIELGVHVVGAELNGEAIPIANKNGKRNGVNDLITHVQSDLFQNVKGTFDVILFNAPRPMTKELLLASRTEEDADAAMKYWHKVQYRISKNHVDVDAFLLRKFLQALPNHMHKNSRVYLMTDVNYAQYLPAGLKSRQVSEKYLWCPGKDEDPNAYFAIFEITLAI